MKIPILLWVLIVLLIVSSLVGLCLGLFTQCRILGQIADFALVLTLVAVLFYVYYTYMLAKEAWTISASFALVPIPNNPYHFIFLISNHSKHSLHCWCKLNPTVYGQPVILDKFYGGESSFDVQPFVVANGHFDIKNILAAVNRTIEEMRQKAVSANPKEQLYMNIEFWYSPIGTNIVIRNPRQPHYFNFVKEQLVADF